jgi:hypothetical protein
MEFHKKTAAVLAASMLAVIFAGTSFAGKSSTTPWIGLATVDGVSAASAQPKLGDFVSFNTIVPGTVKNPRVEVLCYQAGQLVYGEAGATTDAFLLGGAGSVWLATGGSASCTANLYYFGSHAGQQTYNWLAGTTFAAGA